MRGRFGGGRGVTRGNYQPVNSEAANGGHNGGATAELILAAAQVSAVVEALIPIAQQLAEQVARL